MQPAEDLTQLLLDWERNNEEAQKRLLVLVYAELRRLANHQLKGERLGHTLQPTALVHEAYLRLVDQTRVRWRNRAHFFAIASQMMRRTLVDHARKHKSQKRGGLATRLSIDEARDLPDSADVDIVGLDEALEELAELDPRQARVVELRFFGGLSVEEITEVLGVSKATVKRDWATAKAWLFHQLK